MVPLAAPIGQYLSLLYKMCDTKWSDNRGRRRLLHRENSVLLFLNAGVGSLTRLRRLLLFLLLRFLFLRRLLLLLLLFFFLFLLLLPPRVKVDWDVGGESNKCICSPDWTWLLCHSCRGAFLWMCLQSRQWSTHTNAALPNKELPPQEVPPPVFLMGEIGGLSPLWSL